MKNGFCYALFLLPSLLASRVASQVSCGGHTAPTCAECPQGNGAAWCNGECTWVNNQCTEYVKLCGGGATAPTCAECPPGESGCTDANAPFSVDGCAWHSQTGLCRDAFSDAVRTASVHLLYSSPVSKPAWLFQRVIPTASADATYFASNGHSFGYGGIQQVNSQTGRVIFSLWDQGGCDQDIDTCDPENMAQTVACGEGVTCASFGGEGTGRKSYFDTDITELPVLDREYYFVTQAAYLGNFRMEYTGYFYFQGSWKLLSRIQVSTNHLEQWWLSGLYNFVEQWTAVDTTKDRGALFGPAFMASEDGTDFAQVDGVTFSHGTLENHEHVNSWQAGSDLQHAVGIETGGDAVQEVPINQRFDYPSVPPYDALNDFAARIPCLNAANDKASIESCLAPAPTPVRVKVQNPSFERGEWGVSSGDPVLVCGSGYAKHGDCYTMFSATGSPSIRIVNRIKNVKGGVAGDQYSVVYFLEGIDVKRKKDFRVLFRTKGTDGSNKFHACRSERKGTFGYTKMTCNVTIDHDFKKMWLMFDYDGEYGSVVHLDFIRLWHFSS